MKSHLKSILYMVVAGALFWLFLPEKYTINMPIQFANSIDDQQIIERLRTADGYNITIYASELPDVRALVATDTGDIIASHPKSGILTLVYSDSNKDGRSDGRKLLLKGLNRPHGITLHDGWLYIAETDAVLRIKYDAKQRKFLGIPHYILRDHFPGGGNHWSRTVKVGPDNKLYISIGSSCNACIESSAKRATIMQYGLNGQNEILFASGLRNTVGFDWHPETQQMYGVDNGRDLLGNNTPPEELNEINKEQHYGWPYKHGVNITDPDYANKQPATLVLNPPIHEFIAHGAPLSLLFLRYQSAPYSSALVAFHGSWNRSKKSGYKVISLNFKGNGEIIEKDFITGFEHDGTVIGRPVDLTEDSFGNIYLSDDYSGKIYKITSTLKH